MIMQINNPPNFKEISKEIRAQTLSILKTWGLTPRFIRWRLSQDPETGMIVLFGILNNKYIARHTTIPFSNYFDPHLLHDLANKLQVQVVSGKNGGQGYAFILSKGQIDLLSVQKEKPLLDENRLSPVFISDWSELEVIEGRINLKNANVAPIFKYDQT